MAREALTHGMTGEEDATIGGTKGTETGMGGASGTVAGVEMTEEKEVVTKMDEDHRLEDKIASETTVDAVLIQAHEAAHLTYPHNLLRVSLQQTVQQ